MQIVGLEACRSLTRLDVGNNDLSSCDAIAACPTIKWLSIAKNSISSLESLRDLEHLEVLNASHNKLGGKVSVGKLTSLKALILNNNDGITSIGGLEKLRALDSLVLSHNQINGALGGWISGAVALQKLSLSFNPLLAINTALVRLRDLQELRLNHCKLEELPDALAANTRLLILEAGSNKIQSFGQIGVIAQLPLLRQLTLKGCPVAELPGYHEKIVELTSGRVKILDNKRIDGGTGRGR